MPEQILIELLYGKGAHANPLACVEDLTAELSGRRVENLPHSIHQIVWHMNFWMDYELKRIRGERPNPGSYHKSAMKGTKVGLR